MTTQVFTVNWQTYDLLLTSRFIGKFNFVISWSWNETNQFVAENMLGARVGIHPLWEGHEPVYNYPNRRLKNIYSFFPSSSKSIFQNLLFANSLNLWCTDSEWIWQESGPCLNTALTGMLHIKLEYQLRWNEFLKWAMYPFHTKDKHSGCGECSGQWPKRKVAGDV